MSSTEWEAEEAWGAAKAVEIRTEAAARGEPAEYAFLRKQSTLADEAREVFGNRAWSVVHSTEMRCYDSTLVLSLDAINGVRERDGRPPLDFIPEVEDRPRFQPPTPKQPRPKNEEEQAFHAWMMKMVSDAYHSAAAQGITARQYMFQVPAMLVGDIMRRFPGLNPAWCLDKLDWGIAYLKPERIDPERVRSSKELFDIIKGVGDEIAKGASEPVKPPLKQ